MRNRSSWFIASLLILLFAAQFLGCEKHVLPELSFTPDTLRFSAKEDSAILHVTTNVITTVEPESNVAWVYADPPWMDESTEVVIHVRENGTRYERSATIPVKSESIQFFLYVVQEAAPVPEPEGN